MTQLQKHSQVVNKLEAALEMLDQAQGMNVDFAVIEAEMMVEDAEFEFGQLADPDPAFVW